MKVKIETVFCFNFHRNFVLFHLFSANPTRPDFLHYSRLEFCSLERFSFDKAADLQPFYPDNDDDPVQIAVDLPFSLSDDDMKEKNDNEQLKAFVALPDKIVLL